MTTRCNCESEIDKVRCDSERLKTEGVLSPKKKITKLLTSAQKMCCWLLQVREVKTYHGNVHLIFFKESELLIYLKKIVIIKLFFKKNYRINLYDFVVIPNIKKKKWWKYYTGRVKRQKHVCVCTSQVVDWTLIVT